MIVRYITKIFYKYISRKNTIKQIIIDIHNSIENLFYNLLHCFQKIRYSFC